MHNALDLKVENKQSVAVYVRMTSSPHPERTQLLSLPSALHEFPAPIRAVAIVTSYHSRAEFNNQLLIIHVHPFRLPTITDPLSASDGGIIQADISRRDMDPHARIHRILC